MNLIEMFTDGSYKSSKDIGGWGVLLRFNGVEKELFGGSRETTNNIMEMTAPIMGLKAVLPMIKDPSKWEIQITTDSQYVQKGITTWIHKWKKNNWTTNKWKKAREPVKNKDLWIELDSLCKGLNIEWIWQRGHVGHRENEIADDLANKGVLTVT